MGCDMKKYLLIIFIVLWAFPIAWAEGDWLEPGPATKYDWRHTNWFGLSGGTSNGGGISFQHWGEHNGFQATLLPVYVWNYSDDRLIMVVGGAYMSSLNQAPAQAAGSWGGTTSHFYWYAGGLLGLYNHIHHDHYQLYVASAGLGLDLNRRDARWTFKVGCGPYYLQKKNNSQFRFYPTFEIGWHFGVPQRVAP